VTPARAREILDIIKTRRMIVLEGESVDFDKQLALELCRSGLMVLSDPPTLHLGRLEALAEERVIVTEPKPTAEQLEFAHKLIDAYYRADMRGRAVLPLIAARDAQLKPRWIPCSERMPPHGTPVVARDDEGCLWLAQRDRDMWVLLEADHGGWQEAELVKWCAIPEDADE
jgi:hypothetical protein